MNITRPLSKSQRFKIRKFAACDDVKRFAIGSARSLETVALCCYCEAYEGILKQEGATIGDSTDSASKQNVYPIPAIRRLGKLNDAYWAAARPFIIASGKPTKAAPDLTPAEDRSKPEVR